MRMREPTEAELQAQTIEYLRSSAYDYGCPWMNRAERRTARGKMLMAQGELAAANAELAYLRELLNIESY